MKCEIQSFDIINIFQELLPVACFTPKLFYVFYHEVRILTYCITCCTTNGALCHKLIIVLGRNITLHHEEITTISCEWPKTKNCSQEIISNSFFKKTLNKKFTEICKETYQRINHKSIYFVHIAIVPNILRKVYIGRYVLLISILYSLTQKTAKKFYFRGRKKKKFINEI